ncbi:MAG: dienelactone hydrolase family protein [Blastocatellia bacterium]|nr:dienelactone hydrolase family protein [Blastocatellia bacterium]
MVTIKASDGGEFQSYLALPPAGRGPGIVLMQEIFGVNKVMRDIADWYAARGFAVICPDLFWRQEPGIQLTDRTDEEWQRAFALYQGLDEAKAVDDAAQSMAFLRAHPACTGKVGGVGFCLGGKLAYLLATRHDPDASVGYYGVGIESALDEAANIDLPVMLHIAAKDQFCPPEAQAQIHAALDGNSLVTVHDYPGQDHAFARSGGAHYDAAAAELANLRTVDFFLHHLTGGIAPSRQRLSDLWDEHMKYEFETRNTEDTLSTMVEDAYVNHIPVLTGGVGHDELREFYSKRFIPQMPPDTEVAPISRTIGDDRVVDEMVFKFTHTIEMDWMLPGIAPTGKRVEVPLVVVIHFRGDKLAHEHIYWDQASVLVQLGLLDGETLPVAGIESAEKALDPRRQSNELIARADRRKQ